MKEMQITLNQDEIEASIRKYVNEQVNIREGQEITIDLKAGRGENGFLAIIDIVPVGVTKPVSTPVSPPGLPKPPTFTNPTAGKPVPVTPLPSIPVSQETAQEAASEAAAEPVIDGTGDEAQAAVSVQAEMVKEESTTQEAAPTDEKPRSLFASLGKPRTPA